MIALAPAWLEPGEDFWASPQGGAALERFFAGLGTPLLRSLVAVGDAAPVLEAARKAGCRVVTASRREAPEHPLLPPGSAAALTVLGASQDLEFPLALLNFRNPFLDARAVEQAQILLRRTGAAAVASAREARDHPCQLKSYYRIRGGGLLNMLEPPRENEALLAAAGLDLPWPAQATRPFVLDWEARGIAISSGLFQRVDSEFRSQYQPWSPGQGDPEAPSPEELWWKTGPRQARRLIPETPGLAGCTPRGSTCALRLVWNGNGSLSLTWDAPGQGAHILRLAPFTEAGVQVDRLRDLCLETGRPAALPLSGDDLPAGYVLALFSTVTSGGFDLWDKFPPAKHCLWDKDNSLAEARTQGGRLVAGRQDFAPVLSPDRSLALLSHRNPERLDDDAVGGRLALLPLDANRAFDTSSPLELCRLLAALEERP